MIRRYQDFERLMSQDLHCMIKVVVILATFSRMRNYQIILPRWKKILQAAASAELILSALPGKLEQHPHLQSIPRLTKKQNHQC